MHKTRHLAFSIVPILVFITMGATLLDAAEGKVEATPVRPKEPCHTILGEKSCTSQEKWVWGQICLGKVADFNITKGYGGSLDPREPKEWVEKRVLRPKFLETILLFEPYRDALTTIKIKGRAFRHCL